MHAIYRWAKRNDEATGTVSAHAPYDFPFISTPLLVNSDLHYLMCHRIQL